MSTTFTEESTSRFVDAGGVRLHYNEAGSGVPLVLLHGGGPGASGWSNFHRNVPLLSEHYRLLIVDQPGYGKSDKPTIEEPIYDFYGRALCDFLDALQIERAHFLGNSLGGGTALKFAMNYPERVERLMLMGPAVGIFRLFSPFDVHASVGQIVMRFIQDPSRQRVRDFCELMVSDTSLLTEELIDQRHEAAVDPAGLEWLRDFFSRMARGESKGFVMDREAWRDVDRVKHRTLLLWGLDDKVNPVDGAFLMLRQMPDVRLLVLPHCGHWAQWERHEEFDRAVLAFLDTP